MFVSRIKMARVAYELGHGENAIKNVTQLYVYDLRNCFEYNEKRAFR